MGRRITVTTLLFLTLVVAVAVSASFPVGLSYAASDSMAPTIGTDDGFIRVPAGDVEPGDIIVFESPSRDRQYTVHRVVGETPAGFVTKGDNNEVTDQAAGSPYVQRERVHGAVLALAGNPVILPDLGVLIEYINDHQMPLVAVLAGLLAVDAVTEGAETGHATRAGDALNLVTAAAVVGLVVLVLLGGATAELSFVAVEGASGAPQTVAVGEPATKTIHVTQVSRTPLTHYAVDTARLGVLDQRWDGSTFELTTRIPPQQTTGVYQTTVAVHAYPVSLPPSVIDRLHAVHPVVAAVVTAVAAVGPWYLLGRIAVDTNARLRAGPSVRRVRRRLHRWL